MAMYKVDLQYLKNKCGEFVDANWSCVQHFKEWVHNDLNELKEVVYDRAREMDKIQRKDYKKDRQEYIEWNEPESPDKRPYEDLLACYALEITCICAVTAEKMDNMTAADFRMMAYKNICTLEYENEFNQMIDAYYDLVVYA